MHAVLSSDEISRGEISRDEISRYQLCFSKNVNRPFVQRVPRSSHVVAEVISRHCRSAVFKRPWFYLILAPKCQRGDAGDSEMPERSPKVLPLREKVKVLDSIRKEKNQMLR